jgi:hypothetical protein
MTKQATNAVNTVNQSDIYGDIDNFCLQAQ